MIKKIFFLATVVFLLSATVFYSKGNPRPKNIILLIGDGMGLSQVLASVLSTLDSPFKKFLTIGLINTCAADNLITDSAASATAYTAGYPTNNASVGIFSYGVGAESFNGIQNNFIIGRKLINYKEPKKAGNRPTQFRI